MVAINSNEYCCVIFAFFLDEAPFGKTKKNKSNSHKIKENSDATYVLTYAETVVSTNCIWQPTGSQLAALVARVTALEATVAGIQSSVEHMCTMFRMDGQSALFLPTALAPTLAGHSAVVLPASAIMRFAPRAREDCN